MIKKMTFAAATLLLGVCACAQSQSFSLGQWSEIHNNIIKELSRSYVDSLPVGRIMKAGIDAMLEELDPYTIYIPEEDQEDFDMMISKSYGGIGAVIYKEKDGNVVINEPYWGSPAQKNGLRCGDEILAINGESVIGMVSKDASEKMKGKPGSTVRFKIKKVYTSDTVDIDIVREKIHLPDVEYAGMLDDTTGYIFQSGFTDKVYEDIKSNIAALKQQGMKRLVYDLRGNGGGLMGEAIDIVSLFVPKGSVVVSSKGRSENSKVVFKTTKEPVDTQLPVIMLIDGYSASASEIVTGALQDLDRAVVMGTRSYGKGLVQSIRPIAYNGQMKVTTAKYYTPSGRCVQAIDYSERDEKGNVGHIPDSLTHEFRTAHGRIVRDGGGITPDIELNVKKYSRLVQSLVLNGVIDQYALKYVREHETAPALEDFHFTDYDDFVEYAKNKEFDYRSQAKALFDQMKKELDEDGLADGMSEELAAIQKGLEMDKEKFIRMKKDEIIPFIEEEIAVRYYFQEAGIKIRLRYDTELKEALKKPAISLSHS